jgi:hypothetical protein
MIIAIHKACLFLQTLNSTPYANSFPIFNPVRRGAALVFKQQALAGIFWILENGLKWKYLPKTYGFETAATNLAATLRYQ